MRAVAKRSLAVLAWLVAPVAAQRTSEADEAFRRGRDLFKAGMYVAACPELERSHTLDPQLGTLFNLAQCHEKIGKLASALAAYREVVANDINPDRQRFASDLAEKLAARVPKLIVQIAGKPPGLTVLLGERSIPANEPVELDNGDYVLTVRGDGVPAVTTNVRVHEEGRTTTIVVPLTGGKATVSRTAATPAPERSRRKLYGISALAVGGATVVTGAVFGALAITDWNDAKSLCDGSLCASQPDADRANALRDRSLDRATISNVLFAAGGAVALAGVVLWVTAPSDRELSVDASASSDGASVTLFGRF